MSKFATCLHNLFVIAKGRNFGGRKTINNITTRNVGWLSLNIDNHTKMLKGGLQVLESTYLSTITSFKFLPNLMGKFKINMDFTLKHSKDKW